MRNEIMTRSGEVVVDAQDLGNGNSIWRGLAPGSGRRGEDDES
jgi:hypothetical protein